MDEHVCERCGQGFAREDDLRRHEAEAHRNDADDAGDASFTREPMQPGTGGP
jgi:hypothetical protein